MLKNISPTIEIIDGYVEAGFQASNNEGGGISAPGWGTI